MNQSSKFQANRPGPRVQSRRLHVAAASKRGILILPGLGNSSKDYTKLASKLESRGFVTEMAPVARLDWARNALALGDIRWWQSRLEPRPAVDWYIEAVDKGLESLRLKVPPKEGRITFLTHSAGGWLGRTYLHSVGREGVDRFVSLGSPHLPPPPGVVDQTRGILTYCNRTFPGSHHKEIQYTTVASNYIKGIPISREGGLESLKAKFAGAGYEVVCGSCEVEGDFIVPVPSAHLEGAEQITINGAYHSPLGSALFGAWYGDEPYLDQWISALGE